MQTLQQKIAKGDKLAKEVKILRELQKQQNLAWYENDKVRQETLLVKVRSQCAVVDLLLKEY